MAEYVQQPPSSHNKAPVQCTFLLKYITLSVLLCLPPYLAFDFLIFEIAVLVVPFKLVLSGAYATDESVDVIRHDKMMLCNRYSWRLVD